MDFHRAVLFPGTRQKWKDKKLSRYHPLFTVRDDCDDPMGGQWVLLGREDNPTLELS